MKCRFLIMLCPRRIWRLGTGDTSRPATEVINRRQRTPTRRMTHKAKQRGHLSRCNEDRFALQTRPLMEKGTSRLLHRQGLAVAVGGCSPAGHCFTQHRTREGPLVNCFCGITRTRGENVAAVLKLGKQNTLSRSHVSFRQHDVQSETRLTSKKKWWDQLEILFCFPRAFNLAISWKYELIFPV